MEADRPIDGPLILVVEEEENTAKGSLAPSPFPNGLAPLEACFTGLRKRYRSGHKFDILCLLAAQTNGQQKADF